MNEISEYQKIIDDQFKYIASQQKAIFWLTMWCLCLTVFTWIKI
jgi:hypothetical protein